MSNHMSIPENSCDPNLTCCRDELQSVPPDPVSMTTNDAPTMGPICSEDGGFVSGDYYGDAPIRENKFQANHTKLAHAFSLGEFVLGILAGPAGCAPVDNSASAGDGGPDDASQPPVPQGNRAPELQVSDSYTVTEGQTLSFTAQISDPDGDQITLSAYGLPDGAAFDPSSGHFSWRTGYDDAGEYEIAILASDGRLSVSRSIVLHVNDVNRRPVFSPVEDVNVRERDDITFTVSATDPEGDPITLSTGDLPSGASFDPETGIFIWTPDHEQAGDYTIDFEAYDGHGTSTQTVNVTVEDLPLIETVGDEMTLSSAASPNSPEVAIQEDGSFMAVWLEGTTTVKAKAFGADGTPFGLASTVYTIGSGGGAVQKPLVSVHRDGSYLVSWTVDPYGPDEIYLRRFDGTGSPLTEALLVKTASGICGDYALAAARRDTNYDFVLAYTEREIPCTEPVVIKVSFPVFSDEEPSGVWIGDEIPFGDADAPSYAEHPTIAMGSDGGDFYGRSYVNYDRVDAGTTPCWPVTTAIFNQWTSFLDSTHVRPPPGPYSDYFCPQNGVNTVVASPDSADYAVILGSRPYSGADSFAWVSSAGGETAFSYDLLDVPDGFIWSGGLLVVAKNETPQITARYFDLTGTPLADPLPLNDLGGTNPRSDGNSEGKVVTVWQETGGIYGRLIQLRQ